jgi:putative two-component system response regulator
MTHEQSSQIIIEGSGKHFDPDIVNAFIALQDKFKAIAEEFSDNKQFGFEVET